MILSYYKLVLKSKFEKKRCGNSKTRHYAETDSLVCIAQNPVSPSDPPSQRTGNTVGEEAKTDSRGAGGYQENKALLIS